ncbi:MAG: helix-turn-helix domain-containing protein [Planctomycetales bacterium]
MSTSTTHYLTPADVADILGVAPESVVAWLRSGELVGIDVSRPGSSRPRYRISPDALAAFVAARASRREGSR